MVVTFIDDCYCITWIFLLKQKSEVFPLFEKVFRMIHTQFRKSIRHLLFDNGREYVTHDMTKFLFEQVIVHELTYMDTP